MEEIDRLSNPARFKKPPLTWGNDRIGIRALRERRSIVFIDEPSSAETVPSKSGHLVVCEQGEPLAASSRLTTPRYWPGIVGRAVRSAG
jgi:hypothetical protein